MQDSDYSSIIVSITKFSIVIGSPRAYLSRNRCTVMWCLSTGIKFQFFFFFCKKKAISELLLSLLQNKAWRLTIRIEISFS